MEKKDIKKKKQESGIIKGERRKRKREEGRAYKETREEKSKSYIKSREILLLFFDNFLI